MSEINLPQELIDKAVEAMVGELLRDGINWNLRDAVEKAIERKLLESGIVDAIADGVVTRVMSDQDAIIAQAGDAIIAGIGQALAKAYKAVAREIIDKIKAYSI